VRVLILNTDYESFMEDLYGRNPGLEKLSYQEQMSARNDSLFGVADFYSSNLRQLGHEAWDIHANNEFMQKMWARKRGLQVDHATPWKGQVLSFLRRAARLASGTPARHVGTLLRPLITSLNGTHSWFYSVLAAQIQHFKPDVILNQAMDGISNGFLREMKRHVRLLVGQIASPLPHDKNFGCYDLIISSLPNFVDFFRRTGVPSELHRLGFEPSVLESLDAKREKIPVSFVGSVSAHHDSRIGFLEYLCRRVDIEIWGQGTESLQKDSLISRCYKGKAWGIDMYQIVHNSKITLNHHVNVAESYANNCRLYEATGVGTMLITDWKMNLHEMFEPGKEVVAYHSQEECAELIQYYLTHDAEREAIARAGQQRTLSEHTYYNRMQELVEIVRRYV
jgi:spore maturation protein CgeB